MNYTGNYQADQFYKENVLDFDDNKEIAFFCKHCECYYDVQGFEVRKIDALDNYNIEYEICEHCRSDEDLRVELLINAEVVLYTIEELIEMEIKGHYNNISQNHINDTILKILGLTPKFKIISKLNRNLAKDNLKIIKFSPKYYRIINLNKLT